MLHVQCRCGAIGIDVAEEPIAQIFCHCDDCQTVHGAAYVPESVYRAEAVTISRGNPKQWTLYSIGPKVGTCFRKIRCENKNLKSRAIPILGTMR